jgi:broad specificity phosphatase PhoE
VPQAAIAADLGQALDRVRALAAEIALDGQLAVDELAQLGDLVVGEVADLLVGRQAERRADALRGRRPDPVDVGQPDLEPLLIRKVHSGDTCHAFAIPASACAAGSSR